MKPITFSQHSLEQMTERGASEAEVIGAIRTGNAFPPNVDAKDTGRISSTIACG